MKKQRLVNFILCIMVAVSVFFVPLTAHAAESKETESRKLSKEELLAVNPFDIPEEERVYVEPDFVSRPVVSAYSVYPNTTVTIALTYSDGSSVFLSGSYNIGDVWSKEDSRGIGVVTYSYVTSDPFPNSPFDIVYRVPVSSCSNGASQEPMEIDSVELSYVSTTLPINYSLERFESASGSSSWSGAFRGHCKYPAKDSLLFDCFIGFFPERVRMVVPTFDFTASSGGSTDPTAPVNPDPDIPDYGEGETPVWLENLFGLFSDFFDRLFRHESDLSNNEINNANQNSQNEINNEKDLAEKHEQEDDRRHEDIMHGWDDSKANENQNGFDNHLDDYQKQEEELIGNAMEDFNKVDMDTGFIGRFTSTFQFISLVFMAVVTSLGDFGVLLTISLTFALALFAIGWFRGGGTES